MRPRTLLKKSPDPYIGLARLYSYNLGDCDRAKDALPKAVEYGHAETRREIATLADAYLRRAAQTVRDSQKFQTMPENERDYLQRARQDYASMRRICIRAWALSPTRRITWLLPFAALTRWITGWKKWRW